MKLDAVKIRNMLFEMCITQQQLSIESGACLKTINSICRGRSCRKSTAAKVAEALGVELDEIVLER